MGIVCPYDWSYPGGVKSHIEGLRKSLVRKGIMVEVCAPSTRDHADIARAGSSIGIPFNGSVARISFSRKSKRNLREWVKSSEVEVLHLHEPVIPSLSLLALMEKSVPCVGTFHASASRSVGYAVARPILSRFISRLDERITVSQAARDLVEPHFPGSFTTIPNGIDLKRFSGAPVDPDLESLRPFVLFVGRPEPRKGFDVAVEAMERVRKENRVNFVVVGRSQREVPDWTVGLGEVSQDRLPSVYAAAHVYLAPSLRGESFGIVLAEAMATGTPVVCSDIPGYKEASAGAALTFETGKSEEAATKVLAVLEDESLRSDLVRRGKVRAAELDWDLVSEQILDTYTRAVS
ncbi:MAG TPA: glycosyltransferase family 4 protein [Actinomycetota bacterium]|nr:glycosyltransferase family 4 protein [Actinomycetota bacterium]